MLHAKLYGNMVNETGKAAMVVSRQLTMYMYLYSFIYAHTHAHTFISLAPRKHWGTLASYLTYVEYSWASSLKYDMSSKLQSVISVSRKGPFLPILHSSAACDLSRCDCSMWIM